MLGLSKDKSIFEFRAHMAPALTVDGGDTLQVHMADCFGGQIKSEDTLCSEIDFGRINPATGPVFVRGAERGDTLAVKISELTLSDRGVAVLVPGEGLLGHKVKTPRTRIMAVTNRSCRFGSLELPLKPMIGVIGVAPSEGSCQTGTPGRHGGNMDTAAIGPGAVLYLPVSQPGGLLAMGDCHAVMGDGEVSCSGCEIEARATIKVGVIKGFSLGWPALEKDGEFHLIVSNDNLDEAMAEATEEAVSLLERCLGLSWDDAYILSGLVMDLRVSQLVDPKKTVRAVLPGNLVSAPSVFGVRPFDPD